MGDASATKPVCPNVVLAGDVNWYDPRIPGEDHVPELKGHPIGLAGLGAAKVADVRDCGGVVDVMTSHRVGWEEGVGHLECGEGLQSIDVPRCLLIRPGALNRASL